MKKLFVWSIFSLASIVCFGQDLVVTSITGPATIVRYGGFTNQITVKNQGIVGISKYVYNRIYLSTDNALDKNVDIEIGDFDFSSLAAGESKTITPYYLDNSFTKIQPGNYYLIVNADASAYVTETDESNNQFSMAFEVTTPNVDFSFASLSLDKSSVAINDIITPTFTVTNSGTTSLHGWLYVSFFLSSDPVFDNQDKRIDFNVISLNNPTQFSNTSGFQLTIPKVAAGNYYLIGVADWLNSSNIDETNENNNTIVQSITVTASNVDLQVLPPGSLYDNNGFVNGTCTVINTGTTGVAGYYVYVVFHQNGFPYYDYSSMTTGQYIPAGGSTSLYVNAIASNAGISSGDYTVSLIVNPFFDITETNYSNNEAYMNGSGYVPPTYQGVTMNYLKTTGTYDNTDKDLNFEVSLTNSGTATYYSQDYSLIIRNSSNTIVFSQNHSTWFTYSGDTEIVSLPISLSQPLPVGQYTVEFKCSSSCSTTPSTKTINLSIQQIQYTLNGTVSGEDGTPLTNGKLFLYEKQDDGTVKFVQQTSLSGNNTFTFQLDTHEHTLYFIPDPDTFANYVPTIYGKTVILSESSFFTASADMNVTFDILKVQSLASGSGIISGQVGSGSSSGRIAPMSSTSYPVVLLSSGGDVVGFTYTDSNGSFTFNNLPRDKYQIVVPLELDQSVMTTPYDVDITSKNEKVSIQLTSNGIALNTEVLMLPQNISFSLTSTTSYGADPIDLSANSDAALPISFSSSNDAIAEVENGKLTIKGAGTVTITATQTGNDFYSPASKDQILIINKANQHITFGALSGKTFGDAGFTVDVNSSADLTVTLSSSDTNIAMVNDNTITIIGAGKVTITATQSGNDLYNEAEPVSQDLEIAKASQTISFGELPEKTNTDDAFTLSAAASSSLDVSFMSDDESIATIDGNIVSIHGAGTVNITALQNGNQNYDAAESVTRSLLVKNVTGIEFSANSSVLFPNPTKGIVVIKSDKKITGIEVTDVTGRTQPVNVLVNNKIDLSDAPQGIYFIKLFANSSVYLYKIVRE